jgi:hypothetical protein
MTLLDRRQLQGTLAMSLATKTNLNAIKISVHNLTRQIADFERFMDWQKADR